MNIQEITGLDKFSFSQQKPDVMLANASASGDSTLTTVVSGDLTLTGEAYNYILKYFINDPGAPLKILFVNVVDDCCNNTVYNLCLTFDGVQWNSCECEVTVTLKEYMPEFTCFNSTFIYDDTNGFISNANTRQDFPKINYCTDITDLQVYFAVMLVSWSIALIPLILAITIIFDVFNAAVAILNLLPGVNINGGQNPLPTDFAADYIEFAGRVIKEVLGCKYYSPSPYVRDYINNVCKVCGLTFSSSIYNDPNSEYYNAVYFFPQAQKGLTLGVDSADWISGNAPILTGMQLMEQLKLVHDADYAIKDGVLYFERRDKLVNNLTFDFRPGGADTSKLLQPCIQYQWNGQVLPAYDDLEYANDSLDSVGNAALPRYNDIIEFNTPFNPNLHFSGARKVTLAFSPARFIQDGIELDAISRNDAIIFGSIAKSQQGVLLMQSDECTNPKLIIIDPATWQAGQTGINNQIVKAKQYPVPNNFLRSFDVPPESITLENPDNSNVNCLYNYPYLFRASSNATNPDLWEFHKIDASNALQFNVKNLSYTLTFNYNCADLKKLDVFSSVYLPLGKGTIDSWEIDFYAKQVILKGQL